MFSRDIFTAFCLKSETSARAQLTIALLYILFAYILCSYVILIPYNCLRHSIVSLPQPHLPPPKTLFRMKYKGESLLL